MRSTLDKKGQQSSFEAEPCEARIGKRWAAKHRGAIGMRNTTFSRRDVIKGSAAVAGSAIVAPRLMAAAPETSTVTPALLEAARKEGKVAFYTAIDLQTSEKIAQGIRGPNTPTSPAASSATGPSACSSASDRSRADGIFAADVVCSTGHLAFPQLESAITCWRDFSPEVARHYPPSMSRPTAPTPHVRLAVRDRLQHPAGRSRRRPQELRRPARSRMEGQARQGPPRLQRRRRRRPSCWRASWLELLREARPAAHHAAAVRLR